MTTIRLSDGIVKDDVLVVGLAVKNSKSSKAGTTSLQIESGDLAIDTKVLMQALSDLGWARTTELLADILNLSNLRGLGGGWRSIFWTAFFVPVAN